MGQFRSDLFYRLDVMDIHLPSLRERTDDSPLLTEHILNRINTERNLNIRIDSSAREKLLSYSFPGNVRELENILERASTLCESSLIVAQDLKLNHAAAASLVKPNNTPRDHGIDSLDEHLDEIEKDILMDTLEKTRWNKTEAAKSLGISFRSMRYRLTKLGLSDD